jgi:hypothetical protein
MTKTEAGTYFDMYSRDDLDDSLVVVSSDCVMRRRRPSSGVRGEHALGIGLSAQPQRLLGPAVFGAAIWWSSPDASHRTSSWSPSCRSRRFGTQSRHPY